MTQQERLGRLVRLLRKMMRTKFGKDLSQDDFYVECKELGNRGPTRKDEVRKRKHLLFGLENRDGQKDRVSEWERGKRELIPAEIEIFEQVFKLPSGTLAAASDETSVVPGYETFATYDDAKKYVLSRAERAGGAHGGALDVSPPIVKTEVAASQKPSRDPKRGFVGRDHELDALHASLAKVSSTRGQVTGVCGEAGVGKSHLCAEFADECGHAGIPVFRCNAEKARQHVSLFPMLELFRASFGIEAEDGASDARAKISNKLTQAGELRDHARLLISEFLGVKNDDETPLRLDPENRRHWLITLLQQVVQYQSGGRPSVIVVEDLHWLDNESADLLELMVELNREAHCLLVVTFRPEFTHKWINRSWYRHIQLPPFEVDETRDLLTSLLGDEAGAASLEKVVFDETRGNALFVREAVRGLAASGCLVGHPGDFRVIHVPERLAFTGDALAPFVDSIGRLSPPVQHMLATAAVLGARFDQQQLGLMTDQSPIQIARACEELKQVGFIRHRAAGPAKEFEFDHPQKLEAAKKNLPESERVRLHQRAATLLEQSYNGKRHEDAAQIANHYAEAKDYENSAIWFGRAAAIQGASNVVSAGGYCLRVLEIATSRRDDTEMCVRGARACCGLLNAAWRTGEDLAKAKELYALGLEFARAIADRAAADAATLRLKIVYDRVLSGKSKIDRHLELAQEVYDATRAQNDSSVKASACCNLVEALGYVGRLDEALGLAQGELTNLNPALAPSDWITGINPYCILLLWKARCLTWLGRLAEAIATFDECRNRASTDRSSEMETYALFYKGLAQYLAGARAELELTAKSIDKLSESLGRPALIEHRYQLSMAYARVATGNSQGALELIGLATETQEKIHKANIDLSMILRAEAFLQLGDAPAAMQAAEAAVAQCRGSKRYNHEVLALGALAIARLQTGEPMAVVVAESDLKRAEDLITQTGANTLAPMLQEWRAAVEHLRGNGKQSRELLGQAKRGYESVGARGQAVRVGQSVTQLAHGKSGVAVSSFGIHGRVE